MAIRYSRGAESAEFDSQMQQSSSNIGQEPGQRQGHKAVEKGFKKRKMKGRKRGKKGKGACLKFERCLYI